MPYRCLLLRVGGGERIGVPTVASRHGCIVTGPHIPFERHDTHVPTTTSDDKGRVEWAPRDRGRVATRGAHFLPQENLRTVAPGGGGDARHLRPA
jgi:hypothetical protein